MSPAQLLALRVALAAIGIAIFGYGIRIDHQNTRWVGIAFVAAAALLRFARRAPARDADDASPGDDVSSS